MKNKIIIYLTTAIISSCCWLAALVIPAESTAVESSCKVVRYGFALSSDLEQLKTNFNGKANIY